MASGRPSPRRSADGYPRFDGKVGQGNVVLACVDVAVAEAGLADGAGKRDLHDVECGDSEDQYILWGYAVQGGDRGFGDGVRGDDVAVGVFHERLHCYPEWAGVL